VSAMGREWRIPGRRRSSQRSSPWIATEGQAAALQIECSDPQEAFTRASGPSGSDGTGYNGGIAAEPRPWHAAWPTSPAAFSLNAQHGLEPSRAGQVYGIVRRRAAVCLEAGRAIDCNAGRLRHAFVPCRCSRAVPYPEHDSSCVWPRRAGLVSLCASEAFRRRPGDEG
jgi:hypothetical protein